MNFIYYYENQGRPDLSQKVLNLVNMEIDTAGAVFEEYAIKVSEMMFFYKLYLTGFEHDMANINCALLPILMLPMPSTCVWLIYQRIGFVRDYIDKNELLEIIPRFNELNRKLARSIKMIRSDADVSPLLSGEDFEEFRKVLSREIRVQRKLKKLNETPTR